MEKRFNRVSMLSFQKMALRKVAVLLWNTPRNLVSIANRRFLPRNWEGEVSDALSKLQLPESLKEEIERISKPICLQIIRWKLYHEAYLNCPQGFLGAPILEKLQWTAAGAIDYRKTAEELVRCDVFDIVQRYKLACLYCLDHYIAELWEELPQGNKTNFYKEEASHITEPHLYYCWPYILKGEEYKLNFISENSISFNQFAFQRSSSQGNKIAAEYFLQKLTLEERKNSIISAAKSALEYQSGNGNTYPSFPNRNISDVVFYLLSEMTPEQQAQIFREKPTEVFECFFHWPWQDVFLDFSDAMWTWMQSEDRERRARNYDNLLDKMYTSIEMSDYCIPNLFQNLFMSSPTDFKKRYVERECSYGPFFMELFTSQGLKPISVIFSNLDDGDKLRVASSKKMFNIFDFLVWVGSGQEVEVFIRGTGLSKEGKLRLKEVLKRNNCRRIECFASEWRRIFEFLDGTDQIKRNSDDEALTEIKKLCCEKK